MVSGNGRGDEPARYMGPRRTASTWGGTINFFVMTTPNLPDKKTNSASRADFVCILNKVVSRWISFRLL
jgi:hypothetical protein